jgi:hypothetical protein
LMLGSREACETIEVSRQSEYVLNRRDPKRPRVVGRWRLAGYNGR